MANTSPQISINKNSFMVGPLLSWFDVKLGKVTKFILSEFLYNGHLQSLSGAGVTFISSKIVGVQSSGVLFLITYLNFQIIHLFDRYKYIDKDFTTNIARSRHLSSYFSKIPFILFGLISALIVILLMYANVLFLVLSFFILVMGLLYPLFFKNLTKRIFLFKNFYVSLVYFLLAFFPVIYYSQVKVNSDLYLFSALVLIETLIGQVYLDIKDTQADRKDGLKTLSAVIGSENTLKVLGVLSLLWGFLIIILSFISDSSMIIKFLVTSCLLINILIFMLIRIGDIKGYWLSAGKFLLLFSGVFLYSLFL